MPNPDDLFTALRAALVADRENLALRLHLAGLLKEHGRNAEAAAEYRTVREQVQACIAGHPADADLYDQLAQVQAALGDAWDAQASLGIATALRGGAPPKGPPPAAPRPAEAALPPPAPRPVGLPAGDAAGALDPEPGLAERPGITFADVGGLADLKERIRLAIIYPFQRPEVFAAYGKRAGGGLLLYGPPGCGKTYIARATAGEVGAHFINIGISDVLDMWTGQSEKRLHAIFETARRLRPTVLFFDEIEALGGNRLDMRQHHQRTLVNQFLAELDGAEGDNAQVLILGATNSPWHVDPALRRPGRFAHVIFIAPPDEEARRTILRLQLQGKPAAADVDVARLARETDGYSGADLQGVVDGATEEAVQEALRTGRIAPLTTAALLRALHAGRPTTLEWLNTAKNYAIYSNEGGVYDEVAAYLRQRKLMR